MISIIIDYVEDFFESYALGRVMKAAENEEVVSLEEAKQWLMV